MLYVDKLLSTPFRVLARMVDTLACRRVEMLLAETLQVQFIVGLPCYTGVLESYTCDKFNFVSYRWGALKDFQNSQIHPHK